MSLVLIALHGELFSRSALNAAFNYCRDMKFKVNVLLVDGGEAPQPILMDFLARLKQAGMSGCLDRQAGPLGRAVQRHASLYKDVRLILVDSMKHWGAGVPLRALKQPVGLLSGVAA
jgi:hypothetical protein